MSLRPIVIVAACAVALAGCGKRGTLERPPPLFGHAASSADDSDPQRKAPTKYDRNLPPAPESQPTSPRTDPLDGPNRGPNVGPNSPQNWLQQNQPHNR